MEVCINWRFALIEWNFCTMAVIWVIWNERNRRIFQHKYINSISLSASINSFIIFWLKSISNKKWENFIHNSGLGGVAGKMAILERSSVDVVASEVEIQNGNRITVVLNKVLLWHKQVIVMELKQLFVLFVNMCKTKLQKIVLFSRLGPCIA